GNFIIISDSQEIIFDSLNQKFFEINEDNKFGSRGETLCSFNNHLYCFDLDIDNCFNKNKIYIQKRTKYAILEKIFSIEVDICDRKFYKMFSDGVFLYISFLQPSETIVVDKNMELVL